MSRIRLPDGCKLAINWEKDNDIIICRHHVIVNFFWACRVSFVKFSYWSKFHVNIMADSGVMTVFVYKRLTRNRKYPIWVLSNICRLGWVRETTFCMSVSIKMLLNDARYRVTAFTVSELVRENKLRGGGCGAGGLG